MTPAGPQRVLVAALDWGLGHASRCIPIIASLQQKSLEVVIAGSGPSLALLREAFPNLYAVELPSYRVKYGIHSPAWWSIMRQAPRWLRVIRQEHREMRVLVRQLNIAIILSDNRYGCWSSTCHNVFIGHQFRLGAGSLLSPLSPVFSFFHERLLRHFQEIWIPDYPDRLLSGTLSITTQKPVRFLGVLSRLKEQKPAKKEKDVLAIVSGPEPLRSHFEQQLLRLLDSSGLSFTLVRGLVQSPASSDARLCNHLPPAEMSRAISGAKLIIARSGYSTIMDLVTTNARALLVPTPGQPEQEYLASRLASAGGATTCKAKDLTLEHVKSALSQPNTLGMFFRESDYLERAINHVHEKISS